MSRHLWADLFLWKLDHFKSQKWLGSQLVTSYSHSRVTISMPKGYLLSFVVTFIYTHKETLKTTTRCPPWAFWLTNNHQKMSLTTPRPCDLRRTRSTAGAWTPVCTRCTSWWRLRRRWCRLASSGTTWTSSLAAAPSQSPYRARWEFVRRQWSNWMSQAR